MDANYPHFTPPAGTVPEGQTEGEATVRWERKPDGSYCIKEFEGEPLGGGEAAAIPSVEDELTQMSQS